MEFKEKLNLYTNFANNTVCSYLPLEEGYHRTILEAMNYSVINGGKRLRPMMMMAAFELIRKKRNAEIPPIVSDGTEVDFAHGKLLSDDDVKVIGPFMAAMEMIHSSSLVHDDLPCMDNDTLRRGKLSTWAKFGEDMGTLAGDALMLYSFETAAKSTARSDAVLKAIRVLAEKSGVSGMVGGQTVDVELTGKKPSRKQLEFIYRNKTGALIEASFMIGAILAGAAADEVETLKEAALNIGMAFQIRDDILDVTSTNEELGKNVGSDAEEGKVTWLTYFGLEQSEEDVKEYTEKAVEDVRKLGGHEFLEELLRYLVDRKN
ncbi:MAG: polyprenyl synthetase family protein [Lachnospiraceae bacterium]|nr:polyprenyl synthetase family protein [Lachnospiraceae bacterium]